MTTIAMGGDKLAMGGKNGGNGKMVARGKMEAMLFATS